MDSSAAADELIPPDELRRTLRQAYEVWRLIEVSNPTNRLMIGMVKLVVAVSTETGPVVG